MAKPPPVVVLKAEPGWHVVVLKLTEKTAGDGPDMYSLSVIPIQNWGIGCPGHLRRSVTEELSPLSVLMGALSPNPLLGQSLPFEPLDPRAETPKFFEQAEPHVLFGVYSPSEGTAAEIAAKVRSAMENHEPPGGNVDS